MPLVPERGEGPWAAQPEPHAGKAHAQPETIQVLEETAAVEKRVVSTGLVRVTTTVDVVEEMARASLQVDTVDVVRVPIDKFVDVAPEVRTEGNTTIIPILEEVLVLEKKLLLKEELHLHRRSNTETVNRPVTLRRQRAVVEHLNEAGQPRDQEAKS